LVPVIVVSNQLIEYAGPGLGGRGSVEFGTVRQCPNPNLVEEREGFPVGQVELKVPVGGIGYNTSYRYNT